MTPSSTVRGAGLQACERRAKAPRRRSGATTVRLVVAALVLLLFTLVPVLQPRVDAQLPGVSDDRSAGLLWRFVRIKYHFQAEGTRGQQDFYGEPWYIDAPAAEQNLDRKSVV